MPPPVPARRLAERDNVADPDASLVARAAAGEVVAFGLLYDRHRHGVFRFALARLGDIDDAHDVVQETFLEALRGLSAYRGDGPFRSWLIVIAYRRIYGQYQARWNAPQVRDAFLAEVEPATPRGEDALDARRALGRCGAVLARECSSLQRRMFLLRYCENCSIAHIANTLERTPAAVKVGLFRARQKLLRELPELATSGRDAGQGDDVA